MIVTMEGVISLTSGLGGYLWRAGYVGDRQVAVAQMLNAELRSKGFYQRQVTLDKDWKSAAKGLVG